MSINKLLGSALESLIALFAAFVAHRVLSVGLLSPTTLTPTLLSEALVVGLLSDLWIATLFALLLLFCSASLNLIGFPQLSRLVRWTILVLATLGVCGHQAYVDFYRAQIIPFHLRYLLDPDFLSANGLSMLGLRPLIIFLSTFLTFAALVFGDFFRNRTNRQLAVSFAVISVCALLGHNRNIHWRVQWFVHDSLQVNFFERLYLHLKTSDLPDPLSPEETRQLADALDSNAVLNSTPTAEDLFNLITKPASDDVDIRGVGRELKTLFTEVKSTQRKPLILIVLLESLRPSETGYFSLGSAPSLTPNLDQIATSSITFTRAFSTGSVTRGAQEAALCGYLGSRDTSLMRGQTTVHLPCLTDLAKKNDGGAAETFWFHGGEGRFDNQVDFWSAHGVDHILSLKDFPEDMARTGWGVGDASLFGEVGSRLEQMKTQSRAPFLLGMILTVSNHIPWTVPADLPTFHPPEGLSHPSYATTAYADAAFGRFIDDLKRRDLWNDTLLIVASDHGNNVEPYADLYGDSPVRTQFLQSHINLLMTGGLVAQSLTNEGKQQLTIDTPVSQADIAALVAYVSGLTGGRFMGENPLRQSRELPVLATLEQEVFDPLAAQSYPRRIAASRPDVEANPQNAKTLLYFRAFLQYTYSWGAARP